MINITVLGAGLVGNAIVKDLANESDFELTVVDFNESTLVKLEEEVSIKTIQANLQDLEDFTALLTDCNLVICAVPGFMGFDTLKKIIKAGKDVVDISFFGEDPFLLDTLAKEKNVTAVVDCGVGPGCSNIIAGYVDTLLDKVTRYLCYVGGLPQVRQWPYEYKVVFSPTDVIEEYIRPARFVEYGQEVVRPALSEPELIDFPQIGTLEAFNTDGLRSIARTFKAPFMKEKTLRYPGHIDLMRVFRESGFFNAEPIEVNGQWVSPLDVTAKLLFDKWKLKPEEKDLTVMQVILEGEKDGKLYRYIYDLFDTYNEDTQTTSMARTTGYTCTIVARQIIKGLFKQKGICPPEFIGRTDGCFEDFLTQYKQRNINVVETVTEL